MIRLCLCALLGAATAFATPLEPNSFARVLAGNITRSRCDTLISDERILAVEQHFAANKVDPSSSSAAAAAPINIYFHVIREDATLVGGNVPDSQIQAQIDVMNEAYAGTGLTWTLAEVNRVDNANWFNNMGGPGTSISREMQVALRKGGAADLNVYTVAFTNSGLLGYAAFPFDYQNDPDIDGIVILYSSVPGGTTVPYDLGATLIHEAGHWVGLYHTFQGGCTAPGDSVDDTPPESSPAFGCPVGRDTCRGGEVDPIHNYMDYTDDSCMTDPFTPGQVERLKAMMATYRDVTF
ncbi:metalloprotease [Moniliophthora roreri MCA 2997]|uniref:Metalloprotease n=1 Tax=Moniliophthora roreri (strain MCA 2997) TaxID=1381753 RepID=V2X9D8_MONRO|nr:metalloprotease [Moniliophthora roreri MCA 2997]KAI3614953.1 metalloprotease [Moniliophthora roreri]